MLTKKRTHRFFLHNNSATHLVVIKQLPFTHVGLLNLFTFYWPSGGKGWHSALQASGFREAGNGSSNVPSF
jgi:hypothetical protein